MDLVIVHDDRWNNFYTQAVKRYPLDPEKFANSMWKAERRLRDGRSQKLAKGVKFISMEQCPKEKVVVASKAVKCQAVTMSGRPCPFRATSGCGKFCKKHIIVE